MKRLIIAIMILSISLGFSYFSFSFIKSKTNELDAVLSQCYEYIKKDEKESAEKSINEARAFWQNNKSKFKILIDAAFCETTENCLDSLYFCFNEKEYTEAKNSINECRNNLRQIVENERISLEVIL